MITIPESGMVTTCDPIYILWAPNISGMAEDRVVKFCQLVGYVKH